MTCHVLDAWAILAWLSGEEPAASVVEELLNQAASKQCELLLSIINFGEVVYLCNRRVGAQATSILEDRLRDTPITLVPATDERVLSAAYLKSRHAVSYADAFAAALALETGSPLVTGDPDFQPMEKQEGLKIFWLARRTIR